MRKHSVTFILILMFFSVLDSCSGNSMLADLANSKQRAAKYYYEQGDYRKARKNSSEALILWKKVRERRPRSYPEWAVENNIGVCEKLLELIPTAGPDKVHTVVPIRMVKGNIVVDVLLNQGVSSAFILDTGAEKTVITPELAKLLKIDLEKIDKKITLQVVGGQEIEASLATLSEIQIGDAIVKNLSVGITSIMPGQRYFAGLLGADFLTNFTVTIDHELSKLTLAGR